MIVIAPAWRMEAEWGWRMEAEWNRKVGFGTKGKENKEDRE